MAAKNKSTNILLTWDAAVHGFAVTAKTLNAFQEKGITFKRVFYLMNRDFSSPSALELKVFKDVKEFSRCQKELQNDPEIPKDRIEAYEKRLFETYEAAIDLEENKAKPEIILKTINLKSPTHYSSIYSHVRELVEKIWKDPSYQKANWYINLSPGTPQMHVVWLMLNAGGHLPPGTQLMSSQIDRSTGRQILESVNFKPQTYLSEILSRKFERGIEPIINPAETRSPSRKAAEEKIQLFGSIPNAPLLLMGERGSGKSTYVRRLLRDRSSKTTYRELTCGMFSEELMRSELFGHVAGAFTGANQERTGILGLFNEGGILFLDEIHDLSKSNQRTLMQALQTGTYYPLGSSEPKKAVFRLVCATNLPLHDLVGKRLDPDFFDRIARFIVEIPPLRESKSDLEYYWSQVWKEVASFDSAPASPPFKLLKPKLESLDFPGNFRDLQRIASHILAYKVDKRTDEASIEMAIKGFEELLQKLAPLDHGDKDLIRSGVEWKQLEKEFRYRLAKWAVDRNGGSIQKAADELGVVYNTISNAIEAIKSD